MAGQKCSFSSYFPSKLLIANCNLHSFCTSCMDMSKYWHIVLLLLLLHPFNSLFSRTTWVSRHQKGKPFWILLEQEMMGWQWHQLDHMQTICTLLQTDNHASTSPLSYYRPDALSGPQPTASKHWRPILTHHSIRIYHIVSCQYILNFHYIVIWYCLAAFDLHDSLTVRTNLEYVSYFKSVKPKQNKVECGSMPNVMAALPNKGGALCSTPQSSADAHYLTDCRAVTLPRRESRWN